MILGKLRFEEQEKIDRDFGGQFATGGKIRGYRFRTNVNDWPGPPTHSVSFHRPGAPRQFCQRCGRNEDYTAIPGGARLCIECDSMTRDGFVECRDESAMEASDRRMKERWHEEITAAVEAPVDLSGLLGTPAAPDATADEPVDSPKPGECYYCKTRAVRMTGDGRPVCLFHKQFFFTRQLREDELCKS